MISSINIDQNFEDTFFTANISKDKITFEVYKIKNGVKKSLLIDTVSTFQDFKNSYDLVDVKEWVFDISEVEHTFKILNT